MTEFGRPRLVPEYVLEGPHAWGPVDYVIMYALLGLLVTEVSVAFINVEAHKMLAGSAARTVCGMCDERGLNCCLRTCSNTLVGI